ncbi:MAG: glutathione S-transferase family protein [Polyangiales bacterium]
MSPLVLHSHPLASFCHKVLIALYENEIPFEHRIVDLRDQASSAPLREAWAVGKIPVLFDGARAIAETTIIVEYLQQRYPGARLLLPADSEQRLTVRLWDRFFDNYVQAPMQRIVFDKLRGWSDPGVDDARETLRTAYEMLEKQLGQAWVTGDEFTLADCAAAPALFYARTLEPVTSPKLSAYFERLIARPSVARVLEEARPWVANYPFADRVEARFR